MKPYFYAGISLFFLTQVQACAPDPQGAEPVCVTSSSQLPPLSTHPKANALAEGLQQAIAAGIPGASLAIRDENGVWEGAAGFADLDRGLSMQTCHSTRIASVTKPFVAATLLRLVEQGLIDLDQTVAHYLPNETERLPHAKSITVHQLLNHTSGVHNFLDLEFVLDLINRPSKTWTMNEAYEHALRSKADFAPGDDWSYSNTNYLLAAWVMEAVSDKKHEAQMAAEIFRPLDLAGTSYRADSFEFDGVVRGYLDLYGDGALVDASDNYANSCVGPDGGMVSTAHDLLVFFDALLAQKTLLSDEMLSEMLPSIPTGELLFPKYGLGLELWEEDGVRGIGHGGHEFGYRTFAYYFPERDVTFVLWFNTSSLNPTDNNIAHVVNAQRRALRDIALRY